MKKTQVAVRPNTAYRTQLSMVFSYSLHSSAMLQIEAILIHFFQVKGNFRANRVICLNNTSIAA